MIDTTAINTWLAIIAIASALQTLMIMGAAFMGWRLYKQTSDAVANFERRQVEPVMARVNKALEDVHEVLDRVKAVDDDVRVAVARTGRRAAETAARVKNGFWPAVAVGRAAATMLASFKNGGTRHARPVSTGRVFHEEGVRHVR